MSTDTLPHGTSAHDLFVESCGFAQAGLLFPKDAQTPQAWWNWYMTTDEWDRHFESREHPNGFTGQFYTLGPGGRLTLLRAADDLPKTATEDAPGSITPRIRGFLQAVTVVLTRAGCPDLRGEPHVV